MGETEQNPFDWNKLELCQSGILDIYHRYVLNEVRTMKVRVLAVLHPQTVPKYVKKQALFLQAADLLNLVKQVNFT